LKYTVNRVGTETFEQILERCFFARAGAKKQLGVAVLSKYSTMVVKGVMRMPPAIRRWKAADGSMGKALTGCDISSV